MTTTKSSSKGNQKLKLTYAYAPYACGDGICIQAYEGEDLYDVVTVNLDDYVILEPNQVVIPVSKLDKQFEETIKHDLVKKVIKRINYGNFDAYGELVELKDDWRDRCVPLESLFAS